MHLEVQDKNLQFSTLEAKKSTYLRKKERRKEKKKEKDKDRKGKEF